MHVYFVSLPRTGIYLCVLEGEQANALLRMDKSLFRRRKLAYQLEYTYMPFMVLYDKIRNSFWWKSILRIRNCFCELELYHGLGSLKFLLYFYRFLADILFR